MNLTDESERGHWQEELNIRYGMPEEEAFENFRIWREKKKTCQRCEGEKYTESCPIKNICKEADRDERTDAKGNDDRRGIDEINGRKTLRIGDFEKRERVPIR